MSKTYSKKCVANVGRNLESFLNDRNVTLAEFSKRTGKSVRTLVRWRYDGIRSWADIELVAHVTGESPYEILSDLGEDSYFLINLTNKTFYGII